jgi:3-hydroxyisobutyrate dehydrogenase-like beta-hydroxyacid dehydrogenase
MTGVPMTGVPMTGAPMTSGPSRGPVGFVGLGNIGRPMAKRLAAWPSGLLVYDVVPEACAQLEQAGAKVAAGVADLAREVGLVCVMVRDDVQVRQVLDEVLKQAREGLVVAVHSTLGPDTPADLARIADRHGVRVLDAPVSGGPMGAAGGSLAMMVGGDEDAFAEVRDALALMSSMLLRAGPIGAGTRMKLARNLLHFVSFTAATEAQRLAEAAEIDLVELGRVVRHTDAITGGPGAVMHRATTAPIQPGDFWFDVFGHVRALGEKDLGFAVELAGQLGVDVPLARLALTGLGPGLGLPVDEDKGMR